MRGLLLPLAYSVLLSATATAAAARSSTTSSPTTSNRTDGSPSQQPTGAPSGDPSGSSSCGTSYPGAGYNSVVIEKNATTWPWQNYKTSSLQPPELQITRLSNVSSDELAPGLVFVAPSDTLPSLHGAKQSAPFIMTQEGELVWGSPVPGTTNFRTQTLFGEPVITFWNGSSTDGANIGHGYGAVHILDDTYTPIYQVCPRLGLYLPPEYASVVCEADIHESYITEQNTLLVTAVNTTQTDLSSVGGPVDGWVLDDLAVELDIQTGKALWIWRSLEHVPVNASHKALGSDGTNSSTAYDYFHVNAIQKVGSQYVINARHTWTTYLVNPDGSGVWNISGDGGASFGAAPEDGRFAWQHHARVRDLDQDHAVLSMFNNNNSMPGESSPTTGLVLNLPLPPGSAPVTVIQNLQTDQALSVDSQGDLQFLPNGNRIQGYGQIAVWREWSPAGGLLYEAQFAAPNLVQSYRTFKNAWQGYPRTLPSLVVQQDASEQGCVSGYVSWNGATEVSAWNVYFGDRGRDSLGRLGRVPKRGFETGFDLPPRAQAASSAQQNPAQRQGQYCVAVGAVDSNGVEVARSETNCI